MKATPRMTAMPAGALLVPAFSSDDAAEVVADEGKMVLLALVRVAVVPKVLLLAVKALRVPALGVKLVEKTVLLGTSEEVVVVVVVTMVDEVVGGGLEVVLVVEGMVLLVVVLETEVLRGTGGSETRAPVTPCLVAQSPRFMPLGQQMVSAVLSCVQ